MMENHYMVASNYCMKTLVASLEWSEFLEELIQKVIIKKLDNY